MSATRPVHPLTVIGLLILILGAFLSHNGIFAQEDQRSPRTTDVREAPDSNLRSAPATGQMATTNGNVMIDFVVFYTPEARNAVGGEEAVRAEINQQFHQLNKIFHDSFVPATARVVYYGELSNYIEHSDDPFDALLTDAEYDERVNTARDIYGGDIVTVFGHEGKGWCGIAYILRSRHIGNDRFSHFAYNVTGISCGDRYSLAHEVGHNLGLQHEPGNVDMIDGQDTHPGAFGFQREGIHRSIMAYECKNISCPRRPFFSSPELWVDNLPFGYGPGFEHQSDEASALRLSIATASRWRPTIVPTDSIRFDVSPIMAKQKAEIRGTFTRTVPTAHTIEPTIMINGGTKYALNLQGESGNWVFSIPAQELAKITGQFATITVEFEGMLYEQTLKVDRTSYTPPTPTPTPPPTYQVYLPNLTK